MHSLLYPLFHTECPSGSRFVDIDILFMFHESTIAINGIQNMPRVIQVINVQNQSKMIPSQVHDDV